MISNTDSTLDNLKQAYKEADRERKKARYDAMKAAKRESKLDFKNMELTAQAVALLAAVVLNEQNRINIGNTELLRPENKKAIGLLG